MMTLVLSLALAPTPIFATNPDRLPYPVDATLAFRDLPVHAAGGPGATGLALTRVDLEALSTPLNPPKPVDPDWINKPEVVGGATSRALEDALRRGLHEIPHRSLVLAPSAKSLTVRSAAEGYRIEGRATIDILSRSGVSPSRRHSDGLGLQHFAIDRLGFEARWTSAKNTRINRRRGLALLDARQTMIVTARMSREIEVRLSDAQRDELVKSVAALLDDERGPDQRLRAEVDLARVHPRLYVHLLDLDFNEYGTYPLATDVNEDLVRRASADVTEEIGGSSS